MNKPTINQVLGAVAYAACAVGTISAEVALAQACGFGPFAWCLPVALDIYVLVALRSRQDVGLAVGVLLVMVTTSHLISSHHLETSWWVVVLVSSVAPLILWRVHRLLWPHQEPDPELETFLEIVEESQVKELEPLQEEAGELQEWVEPTQQDQPIDLETLVEKLVANAPDLPGRGRVMEMYGVSEHTARRALQETKSRLEKVS